MNCAECRENLIAFAEGLLEHEHMLKCRAHLEACAECLAEFAEIKTLQDKLVAHGQSAAEAKMVAPVMRRVLQQNEKPERSTIMSTLLRHRWGFGLGTAATAAAVVLIALLAVPSIEAAAAAVMSKAAKAAANLTTIHLRGQLRTEPRDNFSAINPNADPVPVELWEQFQPTLKWRVDKPGRLAVMDEKSTWLFIKPDYGYKLHQAVPGAFDTQWLHELANLSRMLEYELSSIKAHGWQVALTQQQGAGGKAKSIVTVEAKSGVQAGDYLKNKFFHTADTRRVYVFDDETELLESVKIYLHADSGDKLIFELSQIEYNQPIDAAVFQPELPASVVWEQPMQVLPDNEKYVAMTSEQAARAFFEACGREDWSEAGKFCTMTASLKQHLTGITVVSIGQHFTSASSQTTSAQFVPYEIRLKAGGVKKLNLALKRDPSTHRWFVDGGI